MLDLGTRSPRYHLGQFPFWMVCQHPHHHLQGKEHVVGQILATNQSLESRGSIVLTGIAATAAFLQWLRTLSEYFKDHTNLKKREHYKKNGSQLSKLNFFGRESDILLPMYIHVYKEKNRVCIYRLSVTSVSSH